jgi:hypothetical protein
MLMLDRDGTMLTPARYTTLSRRLAHVVMRLGAYVTRSRPFPERYGTLRSCSDDGTAFLPSRVPAAGSCATEVGRWSWNA